MKKGFAWLDAFAFGVALLLFSAMARGGSVEKNGISVELLENKRISAFAGIAVVNITAKKNYDFKTEDLLATWKKFDLNSPEKGVYSDAIPVVWKVLEEYNHSQSEIRFIGNGTFHDVFDDLRNKTVSVEWLVAKNFSSWRYAFREVTDKTKFKLKTGESIKLKFVGDFLKPRINYDWIVGIDADAWEEFAWWNATALIKREMQYTHNGFLASTLIDYPIRVNMTTNDYDCLGQDWSNTGESASNPISYASKTGSCRTQSPVTFVRVPLLNSTNQSTYWYKNMSVTTTNETDSFGAFNNSYEEVYFAPDLRSWGGRANAITAGASVSNATGLWGANAWNLSEGTNRYFTLASIASFQTNNDFAVKAWVWNDDSGPSGQNMVFSCRNTADGNPIIAMYSSGSALGCAAQKQGFLLRSDAPLNTWMCGVNTYSYGAWHYYVWSYDSVADQATGYVDGIREINAATANFGASTFNQCTIGVDAYNPTVSNDQVDGRINNVFILNRTVSWNEVLADYNSTQLTFGAEQTSAETTVPNASIVFPANNTNSSGMNSTSGLLNVSISVNDNVGLSGINATILYTNATGGFTRSMGNQSAVPNNTITYLRHLFPANTDSQFRWLVEVFDNATTANVVNSSLNFITIDNVPPSSLTFIGASPSNNSWVTSASQTFNATFNETHMLSPIGTCIASWNMTVNTSAFVPASGNRSTCAVTNSSLLEGAGFVVFYVNDSMSNWAVSGARHYRVDSVNPTIGAITVSPANATNYNTSVNFTIRATISETTSGLSAPIIAQIDSVNYTAWNDGTQYRYALNNVLSVSPYHHYSFYANDTAGNGVWSGNNTWDLEAGVVGLNLSIARQEANVTQNYTPSNVNVSAIANITTGVSVCLYQNATLLVACNNDFVLPAYSWARGDYRFNANSSGNTNWTVVETLFRNLRVALASPLLGIYLNGTDYSFGRREYDSTGNNHQVNATFNHSAGVQGTVDYYLNTTLNLTTNPSYHNSTIGQSFTWVFNATFNATTNYTYQSITATAAMVPVGSGGIMTGGGGGAVIIPAPKVTNDTNASPTPSVKPVELSWLTGDGKVLALGISAVFLLGLAGLVVFARRR